MLPRPRLAGLALAVVLFEIMFTRVAPGGPRTTETGKAASDPGRKAADPHPGIPARTEAELARDDEATPGQAGRAAALGSRGWPHEHAVVVDAADLAAASRALAGLPGSVLVSAAGVTVVGSFEAAVTGRDSAMVSRTVSPRTSRRASVATGRSLAGRAGGLARASEMPDRNRAASASNRRTGAVQRCKMPMTDRRSR